MHYSHMCNYTLFKLDIKSMNNGSRFPGATLEIPDIDIGSLQIVGGCPGTP